MALAAFRRQVDEMNAQVRADYPADLHSFMQFFHYERLCVLTQNKALADTWKYPTYHDIVLELGAPRASMVLTDETIGRMEVSHCYSNCYDAAIEHPDYTYVEGYAMSQWMMVRHAWLETPDGAIVDPTWTNIHDSMTEAAYFGVKFSDEFLMRHVVHTGWHSVFDSDWRQNHEILRRGLIVEGGIVVGLGPE